MFHKIVSGGQSGVDRAALDVALALSLPCGGWCPRGRKAEDGRIPDRYPLRETTTSHYPQRTEWNVLTSDGTLILTRGPVTGGTALTAATAAWIAKPCLVVDLDRRPSAPKVRAWAKAHGIRVLNVAGPRESTSPGVYALAAKFLRTLLAPLRRTVRGCGRQV